MTPWYNLILWTPNTCTPLHGVKCEIMCISCLAAVNMCSVRQSYMLTFHYFHLYRLLIKSRLVLWPQQLAPLSLISPALMGIAPSGRLPLWQINTLSMLSIILSIYAIVLCCHKIHAIRSVDPTQHQSSMT